MAPIPAVSVIVPALDAERSLGACLESLIGQTLPWSEFEVIVVDNGSTDGTRAVAERYPVTVLDEALATSYSARNRGAAAAKAPVFAFLDADCRADRAWLENGLRALREPGGAAIVAGAVVADSSEKATLAEAYDRAKFLRQGESVAAKGAAATANLFVRREAFEAVGGFDATLVSGGDEDLCVRCAAAGHAIAAADSAIVRHEPRRTFREIARKCRRIGVGTGQRFRRGRFPLGRLLGMLAVFLPRRRFLAAGGAEGLPLSRRAALFFVDWAMKFPSAAGICRGLAAPRSPGVRGGALRFSLHGVTVEVASADSAFLAPLAATFRDHLAPRATPDILVRFGGEPPEWAKAAGTEASERLGYRLVRGANAVRWTDPLELPGLDLALSLGAERLSVFARHRDPHGRWGGLLRRWLGRTNPSVTRKNVTYFCVYFPLFWWLGRTRGFRLLHAAGVDAAGRGLLFSGLGGAGKSTLSVAALGLPGARLLSNNLVLHDGSVAAAVPEPIQLTAASAALAADGAKRLESLGGADFQSRGGYLVRSRDAAAEMPVDRAVILSFGEETGLHPLTPDDAARALRAGDDLSLETRHYRSFSAVMDLAFPDAPPIATEDPLADLLRRAACFRLVVRRGDPPRGIAEMLAAAAAAVPAAS